MPSTQPVEIGKLGGQTDQRQYIDKTELISIPLQPIGEGLNENGTTIPGSNIAPVDLRKLRLKKQQKQNLATNGILNSNSSTEIGRSPIKFGPEYKIIKLQIDQ